MQNPLRRNRNIGTPKQGNGRNNRHRLPFSYAVSKYFYERLEAYEIHEREMQGHLFKIVVEATREDSFHACSGDDICAVLECVSPEDYGELSLIILRQPKRREERLSPVWGRFIYSYEFDEEYQPAVILEAVSQSRKLKWPRKLSLAEQEELSRLQVDGHKFVQGKREWTAPLDPLAVRRTQLWRTLPHEIGHYVHYYREVIRPDPDQEDLDAWVQRMEKFDAIPESEKEAFAHRYASEIQKRFPANL